MSNFSFLNPDNNRGYEMYREGKIFSACKTVAVARGWLYARYCEAADTMFDACHNDDAKVTALSARSWLPTHPNTWTDADIQLMLNNSWSNAVYETEMGARRFASRHSLHSCNSINEARGWLQAQYAKRFLTTYDVDDFNTEVDIHVAPKDMTDDEIQQEIWYSAEQEMVHEYYDMEHAKHGPQW